MRALLLASMIALGVSPAVALDRTEVTAVRLTISQQMDALKKEDATAAFAIVSPKLKARFTDSKSFMTMVREQFPVIINPQLVSFDDIQQTSYGLTQLLRLVDARGEPWLAFFVMERDKKGRWGVANVVTVRLPSYEA
ncbi:DUF4864 domain-containing protein [Chelatococcus asaccharovorans]|uniref:Uncharacterized protein DUF4864 n=1 Tax=Chelatococcus asaccharovorans TaxID=28210 RepID=A0A2V3U557_9HYPH|nr:DUF4864 domain-containing protein [Chelatococcus asaccharovorans]MBS7703926.1 DUF4864 domain-containing protein [Chelatococcus asaccharovorans]PXW58090.1 uncharacterized protein DUF4864 [Chelatococcus asaccharovorans]CAH1667577.1 conserved exported hypothetical protein [Chelatococcus asaccharovorans]CAH1680856.1 conserved exported hypothetical protein [Chelatococcus asaccharovorans]